MIKVKYAVYRTMSKDRKNHVILSHDDIEDTYQVSYKLYGIRKAFKYTHYNYACYKFSIIHEYFIKNFKDNVLTNLK